MSDSNSNRSKLQRAAQNRARAIVDWARRRGSIQPPAAFSCQDCGRPAEVYDHRDYNKPLDVAPVCQSCNVKRGAGKPVDPVRPVRHAAGYTLDRNGIQTVFFQFVDFEDEPKERKLSELPGYMEELARLPASDAPAIPGSSEPQLWDAWR